MTAQPLDSAALVQALAAADLAYTEPARARRLAESALVAAGDDADVVTAALRAVGMSAAATGDFAEAADRLRRAATIAESAGLALRAGQARGSLAYVLLLTSGAQDALRELDRADAALPDGVSAARLQMQRGLVLSEIRRFDEAAASLDRALRTLARAGGHDLLEADIRTNRAIVDLGRRDWDGAHDQLRQAEALYARGDHLGRTAMVYHNRGIVDALRGELPAALAAFDEAAERYRDAGLHPGLLPVDRADALLGVGLVAEARQSAADAVAEFTHQRNAVDLVQARLLLAEAALLDGDPATARREADRAHRSARSQGRPRWAALGAYLRLQARYRDGDRTPAMLTAGTRSVTELAEAGWLVQSLDARLTVARTALILGRPRVARRQLTAARSARHTGPAEVRARAWHAEALLRLAAGDQRGGARAVRAGLAILDQFQASLGATDLRAHASVHAAELARLGMELAVESGRAETILAAAERGRAGALRYRPARPPDDTALARDLAELRDVVTQLRSDDVTDTASLLARQQRLEHQVRDRARHAAGSRHRPERPPTPTDLRVALGRSALIEYLEFDGDLHAVVLASGRLTVHRLGPISVAENALDALRTGLSWLAMGVGSARSTAAVTEMVARTARDLDALLLGPIGDRGGDGPLVIVPTGALHAMPWSALPSCATRSVSVAPSAALWYRAATDAARGSATNTARSSATDAARGGGPTVLAQGPGLPYADGEADALAALYDDARALTGDAAGVAPLLAALDGAEVAHLAAHGHFRADNPMFSELRFADGPLTVYDLERLAVPPRHVVLAACDSGLAAVSSGDELIGLAAALLAMGSITLVAAVIPVPDAQSRTLMLRFHRHLTSGYPAAQALQRARVGATDSAARGFVCFGAG